MNLDQFVSSKSATTLLVLDDSEMLAHLSEIYGTPISPIKFHILKNPTLHYYHRFIDAVSNQRWIEVDEMVYELLTDSAGNRAIAPDQTLNRYLVDHIASKILNYLVKPEGLNLTPSNQTHSAPT